MPINWLNVRWKTQLTSRLSLSGRDGGFQSAFAACTKPARTDLLLSHIYLLPVRSCTRPGRRREVGKQPATHNNITWKSPEIQYEPSVHPPGCAACRGQRCLQYKGWSVPHRGGGGGGRRSMLAYWDDSRLFYWEIQPVWNLQGCGRTMNEPQAPDSPSEQD